MQGVELTPLTGEALRRALPDLARLRISVFRAWPYLYDGDEAYERGYLQAYAESPGAFVVGASVDGRLVGAATAAPMEDHAAAFADALRAAGLSPEETLYCGESVLDPAHRGRGIGHAFFDAREAHARRLGRAHICFCGVVRDPDDPRRPADYRPLDPFWRKRGYQRLDGVTTSFAWKEVGGDAEVDHAMAFWGRATPPSPRPGAFIR